MHFENPCSKRNKSTTFFMCNTKWFTVVCYSCTVNNNNCVTAPKHCLFQYRDIWMLVISVLARPAATALDWTPTYTKLQCNIPKWPLAMRKHAVNLALAGLLGYLPSI